MIKKNCVCAPGASRSVMEGQLKRFGSEKQETVSLVIEQQKPDRTEQSLPRDRQPPAVARAAKLSQSAVTAGDIEHHD